MSDLRFSTETPTDAEKQAVDEVVALMGPATLHLDERYVVGGRQRADQRRTLLLPALHALQKSAGWVSPGGLDYVCRMLEVPPAEAYGVATFYHLLGQESPEDNDLIHVCDDVACRLFGATELMDDLAAGGHQVKASPCLGQCERGPAVLVQRIGQQDLSVVAATKQNVEAALGTQESAASVILPQQGQEGLPLLGHIGLVDPQSLESYREHGGYRALTTALELGGDRVIEEITTAGLSGRGGAAFPTGVKWRAVADQQGRPRHVVCNADESEPGTFKDRTVMEGDPFALLEAMTIAGVSMGAEQGWIYLRGEYPVAAQHLQGAINQANTAGLLGDDVAGSGHKFTVTLRLGAGAYICGEETALFNSIEGFRGEPRNKPPFPTTHGLFGEPTAINNVETLLNVLPIVRLGGADYAASGTQGSPGTRLFCLSGRVVNPGTYEHEFGVTLREVIEAAGGVADEASIRAVLLGGAAGSFVGPEQLDLPLTLEDTRAAGVSLGSGVVMVFTAQDDLVDTVRRIAQFFRDESCGQCVPCRVGTVRQEEVLVRLGRGKALPTDEALFGDLEMVMKDASICGLGQAAASAVRSAMALGLLEVTQ